MNASVFDPGSSISTSDRLNVTAKRVYSRMGLLGLNETELAERCSVAAANMPEDDDPPGLTRDRVSKILMNRHDAPARSAARVITDKELALLARVLGVSTEWLLGQGHNWNPVVWNVLGEPDRVLTFVNLLQGYEELGKETKVWSQYPMHIFTSEAFGYAFNQAYYGGKRGVANPKALWEFYNRVARMRRKQLLRCDRQFDFTNFTCLPYFEEATCGAGIFSVISKSVLRSNLDMMIDVITNPSLRMKLLILKDEYCDGLEAVRGYGILSTVDTSFSSWNYYNGDIGWSEHSSYTQLHRKLLDGMSAHALCRDVNETVDYLRSLRSRIG
jgi:hypothetical protein